MVRSISMNGWINGSSYGDPSGNSVAYDVRSSAPTSAEGAMKYIFFRRENQLRTPSKTWLLLDEDEKSINDSMFLVDMGSGRGLVDAPARRHGNAYGINFTDGHAEIFKLLDARTINWTSLAIDKTNNKDWEKLSEVTTQLK